MAGRGGAAPSCPFGAADSGAPEGLSGTSKRAVGPGRQKAAPDEDSEVEAILRKHGVS